MPSDEALIREQAAAWFARRRSGAWSGADATGLAAWLAADGRHRTEYAQLAALWSAVGDLADRPLVRAERQPRRAAFRAWWPALGFALLLLAAVGLFRALPELTERREAVVTGPGERKEIALADGSRIQLDADSAILLRSGTRGDTVVMERGEAYFTVVHRPERRFAVEAGPGRIVDIGTRFGVRREGEGVRVAVAEGEVEVSSGRAEPLRLTAGQSLAIAADGAVGPVAAADADAAFAWREGRLVFDRTPLAEAVARINRYWREPLVIADPSLGGLKLSGNFRLDDVRGLLWALEQTLPLNVSRQGGRIKLVAR
ncbi:MAG TPA: FecR domain-containing protein [Rhodocyclaceae bacterium]|nr:FecR domain-containing protein [Rhodocyclaceae bacterium]